MEIRFQRRRLERRLNHLVSFAFIGERSCGKADGAEYEVEDASPEQGLHSSHMGCIRNEILEKRKTRSSKFGVHGGAIKELLPRRMRSTARRDRGENRRFSLRSQRIFLSVLCGLAFAV